MPGSRIIRTLSHPMGVVLAWAALFGFYETCIESGVLPAYLPKLTLTSAEPQGLTSFALSLLLVFRTNSSYGRFDEARKIWGGILNRARNIANQAVTFIPPEDVAGREAVGKWTVGFCRALQAHLQEDADLRTELSKAQPRWSQQEIDMLCNAQHRPIKAISMLSELTRQLSISEFQALQMQENVTFFYDALGGCERLLRTPIPVSYTRHTARFLTIWLALLPLGLWERYHWSMLPVIALIGFLLLGIDEIGITIEEPFGILPLDVICTRAQTDVVSLIKDDQDVVQYIAAVRQGRTTGQSSLPPPAAAPAAPAAAAATPVVVPSVAGRSDSPTGPSSSSQPGVMRTVASLFSNVRNGIGAVAPAPPRAPSPKGAQGGQGQGQPGSRAGSPRPTSPGRPTASFPRASAGTGMVPPAAATAVPAPPPIKPPASNGKSAGAAAAPPPVSGAGFTMSFSGLADGAAAAAAKLSKLADGMTAGTPAAAPPAAAAVVEVVAEPAAAAASPKPTKSAAAEGAKRETAAAAVAPSAATAVASGSGSESDSRSGSARRAANWREELAALRAGREEASASADDEPSASYDGGYGSGADDADDEALRRFGGLAGRSRSAAARGSGNGTGNGESGYSNGNGNGNSYGYSSASTEVRSARPRTRPDWRNQL
ncbi:hypothetical protein PLESTF_000820400 [Pleodorina starrii]|nr:hypothetical protein PLESTF_000820400 [Pleodorina starrii]